MKKIKNIKKWEKDRKTVVKKFIRKMPLPVAPMNLERKKCMKKIIQIIPAIAEVFKNKLDVLYGLLNSLTDQLKSEGRAENNE